MKNNIEKIISTFLLGFLAAMFLMGVVYLSSCTQVRHKTTVIAALGDVTEKQLAQVQSSEILPLFHLDTDPMDGAVFSYSDVSDVSLNRRFTVSLPEGGSSITTNQFDRKRQVQKYGKSVGDFLNSRPLDTIGRNHSSVYLAIARELNLLVKEKADKKILLVYSDLMEHTSSISFYDKRTIALVHSHPQKISDLLFSQMPLDNLSGIEVHFIFQPENSQQDDEFRLVSGFYKKMLEKNGAVVYISANIGN